MKAITSNIDPLWPHKTHAGMKNDAFEVVVEIGSNDVEGANALIDAIHKLVNESNIKLLPGNTTPPPCRGCGS